MLDISVSYIDGVFVKQMKFEQAGDIMEGHLHNHNHITLLAAGKLQVTVNSSVTTVTAPQMIFIHKDHKHDLVALEDNTIAYCIHAIRDRETGEIYDGMMLPYNPDQIELINRD